MSETNNNTNVDVFGANIWNANNPKVAQRIANNAKVINANLAQSSSKPSSTEQNDEQPGFFSMLKDRFTKKCECSCENNNTNKNVASNTKKYNNGNIEKNTQTNTKINSTKDKSCIKLFGSIKEDRGYVTFTVLLSDKNNINVSGGALGMQVFKELKKVMDIKKQLSKELGANATNVTSTIVKNKNIIDKEGKHFINSLNNKKKEIIDAVKKGDTSVIKKTIEQTTGVNVDNVSKKISDVVDNIKDTSNVQSSDSVKSNTSNVKSNQQVVFSLKVLKTQTEAKNDVPASILSILDFLITKKGIEFSNIQTLNEMIEGIMGFFSIEEPQSCFDIIQKCGKIFGKLKSVDGIKSLCQDRSIISFDKHDEQKINMNEWNVLMTIYNELIKLDKAHIDINVFIDILRSIKNVCGNVQSVNLRLMNNVLISKLKLFIETQCNNIDKMSIKEMETVKQNFIDTVCSKDDKHVELSKFLVTYFNYFLNDVISNSFNKSSLSSILQQQITLDIKGLNKQIVLDKSIVLFVKRETIKEFLSKFEDENIVITI